MLGTVLYGPRDIRFEDRPDPKIIQPTDAILRLSATCICGSDLWPYRALLKWRNRPQWATSILRHVEEGDAGIARVKELTKGIGRKFRA
jgi:threonine dehydrogenase-like Zn-dependent dehydrogenase